jgi:hypothetical protein
MLDIALRQAIYLSKISSGELFIIVIFEEDVISPSTLLSFIIKEEKGFILSKEDLHNMMEG